MRKREILMIIIGILLVMLIVFQARAIFVYCSLTFPDVCPLNGCQDPKYGKDCKLYDCAYGIGDLDCEYKKI